MNQEDSSSTPVDGNSLSETLHRQMTLQSSRHTNMHIEAERLKTLANWDIEHINKFELAMLGLYFLRAPDVVKCAFCGVELRYWQSNEEVLLKHFSTSDDCPLLTMKPNDNVPLNPEELDRVLLEVSFYPDLTEQAISYDIEETREEPPTTGPTTQERSSHSPAMSAYPQFEMDDDRIQTFENWPLSSKKDPEDLCEAGFFYTGREDEVTCFSCGGSIVGWTEEDNIWEVHISRFNNCSYVEFVKGEEFIENMKVKYGEGFTNKELSSNLPSSSDATVESTNQARSTEEPSTSSTSNAPMNRVCKVCYDKEYNTVLEPCKHVIVCSICAYSIENCPLCRRGITSITEIIFT